MIEQTMSAARRVEAGVFALLLAAAVGFSLSVARVPGGIAAFWMANGLWVGWLLSRPTAQWGPYVLAGVLLEGGIRQWTTMAGWPGIGLSLANVVEVLAVAGAIRYRHPDLRSPGDYLGMGWTATAATLIACGASALIAAAAVGRGWGPPAVSVMLTWYSAHVVGMVIAGTATLAALTLGPGLSLPRTKRLGFAGSLILLLAVLVLTFRQSSAPVLFVSYPPMLWLAYRYRFAGVIVGTLAAAAVGLVATTTGHGPLMLFGGSLLQRLVLLQAYICVACLMTFPVALAVADQARLVSRVRTSETRYRMLAEYANDIVVRLSPSGERLYVSPSITPVLGWSVAELTGTSHSLVHPDDSVQQQEGLTQGRLGRPVVITYRMRHKDGSYVWIETLTRGIPSEAVPGQDDLLLTGRDISKRVAAQEALQETRRQLEALARTDTLTGLPNRRQFDERLGHAMARSQRQDNALALMYVDIDYFKRINDSYGHPAGDEALRQFAQRLIDSVRAGDTVARIGGDEFAVLIEDARLPEAAAVVAHKLIAAMRNPIAVAGDALAATASIGVAYCVGPISAERLCAGADRALYAAKEAGRNTFHVSRLEPMP